MSFEALVVWLVETETISASVSTLSNRTEEVEVSLSSELEAILERFGDAQTVVVVWIHIPWMPSFIMIGPDNRAIT
jgi:hypothetical protein